MTEIELILSALGTGVSAGLSTTAGAAVTDLYAALRTRLGRRLSGGSGSGEDEEEDAVREVLDGYQSAPGEWETRLVEAIAKSGAAHDPEVLDAARELVAAVDPQGARAGKYVVDASGSQGVQIGDGGTQHNTFR